MPIQLDKILADIAEEKSLYPYNEALQTKKCQDDAWIRVGKKNKLSAHEAKSIFKVLQKKYVQEKMKPSSSWKLFQQMEEICQKEEEVKPKAEPEDAGDMEEESFVEFLEVREEEEEDDGDSDNQDKPMKSNSSNNSPEKDTSPIEVKSENKLLNSQMVVLNSAAAAANIKPEPAAASQQQQQKQANLAFSNALQKKGISLRKTLTPVAKQQPVAPANQPAKITSQQRQSQPDSPRAVILGEGIKRKLQNLEKREEQVPAKKAFPNTSTAPQQTQTQNQTQTLNQTQAQIHAQMPAVEIKQEVLDDVDTTIGNTPQEPINVITIPPNPPTINTDLTNGITTIKTNGYNTRINELDFQKDIIFDSSPVTSASKHASTVAAGEYINIGNFDNQLPPTFFKNLCNSQRHEALGLYVANVMNRVTGKIAAKLEVNILKAIIEAQSDELARL